MWSAFFKKKLGIILRGSHATISRRESGAMVPNIDHLKNIAVYFGVSADYLIGIED